MDFNTQRKIVKKLKEAGKNPLLFIPCLIAACAVVLFMSACRAVDMALSDSNGNFLGIKRTHKEKKAPAAVPVSMPVERNFYIKRSVRKAPLPFRPLWQRAMSLLLAFAFVTMSAEMTASAEIFADKVVVDPVQPITSDYFREKGYNLSGISELDLSSNFNKTSEYAVNVESNAFRGMNGLTTITLGYSNNISFSNSLSDIAPDSTVFVKADTAEEYTDVRQNKITNNSIGVVWDKGNIFYDKIPNDVSNFKAYNGVGKVILEWEDNGVYNGYRFYKFTGTKYQLIKSIPYTDSGLKTVGNKKRYEIEGSTSDASYFIRPYVSVTKEIDGENYSAELTSRKFSKTTGKTLNAGTPTLTYTMSNKTVKLKIKMPTNCSEPTCYMLFSRDNNEYSLIQKFSQSDFNAEGECNFTDPNLFSGKTRSYVVIAYYDVFGTRSDTFPETDVSTAEYTTKRSSRVDVTEARLNPPQNLTVTPIQGTENPDCYKGWSLVWDAPAESADIIGSISYKVYANGIEVASPKENYVIIPVDTQQGENITFSVAAVCDDGSISASEPCNANPVNVKNESVQLVNIKGGNEKANLIFKPFGSKSDSQFSKIQYTVWGTEVSSESDTIARSVNGYIFDTFTLTDEDCTPNNDKDGTYTYTLHPLKNDVKYNFWITSNAEKCNYPSVIKSVTPSQAPQPPANIIAKGYENSGVISWDPVLRDDGSGNYADGYYVTIYKVGVSAPLSNHTHVRSPEPTYTADKLENDVEYYAEVSAYVIVNGSEIEGPTARSNTFTPTITVDNVLNLTATPSGKTLVISWTAVKGASEYVLIRTDPDGSQREIYKGNKTSFTDSFVDNNTEYLYKVMAIRKVDGKDYLSDYSSEQRGIINYALGSVQGLTATGGDGCIILKWDKVTGADGYYVQYSVPDAGSWTTIANVGTNTYTHTGLVNGTVYDYRIIPYVIINNKEEANDIYAQKMQGKAGINLPAPANFTVTAGDGMITLSWTAVKGAEGYNVYLVGYDGTTYLLDQVTKTTAIHTNLSNNTTFTYTVRAFKYVDGTMVEGDYSIYKTATAGIELNAPTDVAAKAGKEQVSLSWKKSNGAEGYVVYAYNISTLSFTPVGIVTKTSFVHTGLVAGREYTYMIAAYKNVNGSVVYSGYSMAVTAIPESSGTTTSGDNSNTEAGDYRIFITGTTPYGMSNSDLISAFAGKGAFNSDIDVRFTLSPDTVTSVQNVLNFYGEGIDSFLIYPMDISIYVAGTNTRATINEGQYLTLTIPVPDELLPYSDHISVVHVSDLNQLEILPSIHVNVGGVDCMQFTANSFSPYAFVVYLPEIGEDTGAGTPVTAQGTSGSGTSGQSAVFSFRNTYLPAIYRRRARNKLYRIVRR